ncbi:MAG: hypothetical protein ACTSRW_07660 [Candidatus Helarchaeota archaeon]
MNQIQTSEIEQEIRGLMDKNNSVTAVTITNGQGEVIFQTSNWDITSDIILLLNSWRQQAPSITVQGIKYSILQCTPERLVGTNVMGMGHIVATNNRDQQIMIAYVTPEGGAGVAYMDVARANDNVMSILSKAAPTPVPSQAEAPAPEPIPEPTPTPAPTPQIEEPISMEAAKSVPSSTWATAASQTDMKNLLWELGEFSKYVSRGDFESFLQNLLTEGDQVKIWELIKILRSLKNFIDRAHVIQ